MNKPMPDATAPVRVVVGRPDITSGVPGNEARCALALAACRMKGVLSATFKRTMAYIEFEDRVVRYRLPVPTQAAVALFDISSGSAKPGSYELLPPLPSQAIPYITAKNIARRERLAKGIGHVNRGTPSRRDQLTILGVRNGTGRRPVTA